MFKLSSTIGGIRRNAGGDVTGAEAIQGVYRIIANRTFNTGTGEEVSIQLALLILQTCLHLAAVMGKLRQIEYRYICISARTCMLVVIRGRYNLA